MASSDSFLSWGTGVPQTPMKEVCGGGVGVGYLVPHVLLNVEFK
jgi:hypothetical protein